MGKPKITPVEEDKFIRSPNVHGLVECNFYSFLNDKVAAMVMYYNPECPDCQRQRAHIIRAAKVTKRDNHAYAAVDCTKEKALCKREGIVRLPTFMLYTRGQVLSNRSFPIDYIRMKEVMENIEAPPPLHPGRVPVDPDCPRIVVQK
ncbi:unnamed protein product [Candidula unifasciata]|uniref:Thioredoxin domain-containing protein n=1 Tax=Candidula unifasciata TaxID=100452 RepID=A0A8S3YUQ2_9EUPU|nr:unnamed protein product [Candidula unifasciata]